MSDDAPIPEVEELAVIDVKRFDGRVYVQIRGGDTHTGETARAAFRAAAREFDTPETQ